MSTTAIAHSYFALPWESSRREDERFRLIRKRLLMYFLLLAVVLGCVLRGTLLALLPQELGQPGFGVRVVFHDGQLVTRRQLEQMLPTFNREESLSRSIRSVLEQTHTNFELLVVDDASTDETVEIAGGRGGSVESLLWRRRAVV